MSSNLIQNYGSSLATIPAGESIAIYTRGAARLSRFNSFANQPTAEGIVGTVTNGVTVFTGFTNATAIRIDNLSDFQVFYQIGVAPAVTEVRGLEIQATPLTLNATGPLTAAMILNGLLTSTTGAAVAGTLPTGAVTDLASEFAIGDALDWSVINTGGNTFTVTAAAGHTIVGVAAVVTVTTGRFRTVKTAADTFITYRIA